MSKTANELSRRAMLGAGSAALLGAIVAPQASASDGADVESIVTDAYVFGYPLVLSDMSMPSFAPTNLLINVMSLPTSLDRAVVRPNRDTLYSTARLDLRAEPMVLHVPPMDGPRYWLMQIMDAWTNATHDPSSVHPQVQPGQPFTYAITGPGWNGALPAGLTPLSMPTEQAWLVGRLEIGGADDLNATRVVQEQLTLTPLSMWRATEIGLPGVPLLATPHVQTPPPQQVSAMDGHAFFNRMCSLLAVNPPTVADAPAMRRFARIGIVPGGNVDVLPAAAIDAGIAAAKHRIAGFSDRTGLKANGWTTALKWAAYGTDYLLRAWVARVALGANAAIDAIYPSLFSVADLDGGPTRFRLHFPQGGLPPAHAFWSITAYDADSYLVDNPAGLYSVGPEAPVVANPDGSVDVAVQYAEPGPHVPRSNWLPIPKQGPFSLTMRLYAREQRALTGLWKPPALTSVR